MFALPTDVYLVVAEGPELEPLLLTNEQLTSRLASEMPGLELQAPARLLPSSRTQALRAQRLALSGLTPASVRASLEEAAEAVVRHAARGLGAAPLCRDARFARAMADLPVFIRQSHAERDLAALGALALDADPHEESFAWQL